MSADAAYTPGSWVAVGAEAGWLLADIDPADAIVLKTWSLLRGDAEVDEILDAVLERGLRAVRSFALVRVSGEHRAVVVRGLAQATVTVDGADQPVSAEGLITWCEHRLPPNATAVWLGAGGAGSNVAEQPLSPGVTLASSVRLAVSDLRGRPRPDTAVATPAAPHWTAAVNLDGPGPVLPQYPVTSVGHTAAESVADAAAPALRNLGFPAMPDLSAVPDLMAVPDVPSVPDLPALPTVPAVPDVPAAFELPAEAAAAFAWEPPPPSPEPPTDSAWATPGASIAADSTVSRASLMEAEPSEIMVQAVRCQHGHLSPPLAVSCRICGFPLMGQAPVTAPRPTLGVLRLSTGEVVPLDRTVIIGRDPKADGTNEAAHPHVVRLPSPAHDISRTHAEIRLDGWHVLLTDLNSVNGTVVTPPWQEPQRLRPNEAVPIEPGTVVSLADEVTFRYEVTE